jgi:DpnII restriction endonuclease
MDVPSAATEMSTSDPAGVFAAVALLRTKYGRSEAAARTIDHLAILGALDQFMECVRYLNTRRTDGAVLTLDSEAAVQDAIYLMLRPWVHDLTPENPTDRQASRFTIKDFVSKQALTVIEAKFVRDRDHGRTITREMHDDIEMYRNHASCRHLIFFVYDPNALIPDQAALRRQIEIERSYAGSILSCYLLVKP